MATRLERKPGVTRAVRAPAASVDTGGAYDAWYVARKLVCALRATLQVACRDEQHCRYAAMSATRPLTQRQREVLPLLLRGNTNKEIAAALHIGERTAKYHVSCLLRIYGAAGRKQLRAALPTRAPGMRAA